MWVRRKPVSWQSTICMVGLCGFVGAELSGIAHEASVIHTRCSEHGELVHAQRSTSASGYAPAVPTFARGSTASLHRHGGHEHCGIVLIHRLPTWLVASASPVLPRVGIDPVSSGADVAHRPVELQLLAPKTSPPFARIA